MGEGNIILREQIIILRERKSKLGNEMHFAGTKSVYVLQCPLQGSKTENNLLYCTARQCWSIGQNFGESIHLIQLL